MFIWKSVPIAFICASKCFESLHSSIDDNSRAEIYRDENPKKKENEEKKTSDHHHTFFRRFTILMRSTAQRLCEAEYREISLENSFISVFLSSESEILCNAVVTVGVVTDSFNCCYLTVWGMKRFLLPNPRLFLVSQRSVKVSHLSEPPSMLSSQVVTARLSSRHSEHIEWQKNLPPRVALPWCVCFVLKFLPLENFKCAMSRRLRRISLWAHAIHSFFVLGRLHRNHLVLPLPPITQIES